MFDKEFGELLNFIRTACDNGHDIQNRGDGYYRCLNCRFELRVIACD